jgi:hypothetical protein
MPKVRAKGSFLTAATIAALTRESIQTSSDSLNRHWRDFGAAGRGLKDSAFINRCAQLVNPDRKFLHHTTFPERKSTNTFGKHA